MVTLKLAQTADGYAAGGLYDSRLAITGLAANGAVHVMRAMHDAIMIGNGTAVTDDPLLTVRLPGLETRKPLRIVLDAALTLSPRSRLALTAREFPTLVIAAEEASFEAAARLSDTGIEIERIGQAPGDRLDLALVLARLAERGLTRIFSEGGPRVAAHLIASNYADEVILFTSPKPLGHEGVTALDDLSRATLADPVRYSLAEDHLVGADRLQRYERVL
jgi:diaminohydroxyphosphoribosylaminopyrimidine deaminase/5-amino-6-(5-phosphoribosylamino)uracil reductase